MTICTRNLAYISHEKHNTNSSQSIEDRFVLVYVDRRVEDQAVVVLELPQIILVLANKLGHDCQLKRKETKRKVAIKYIR